MARPRVTVRPEGAPSTARLIADTDSANARAAAAQRAYRLMDHPGTSAVDLKSQASKVDYLIAEATRLNTYLTWVMLLRAENIERGRVPDPLTRGSG